MVFNNVKGFDDAKVCIGMLASRKRVAALLDLDEEHLGLEIGKRFENLIAPEQIAEGAHVDCQEVVYKATDEGFDLRKIVPAPTNTPVDGGPYITMGLAYGTSPDGSQSDAVQEPSATASLSLNKNSFTLSKAGATYRLKYTLSPEGGKVTFSSSDEKVATVNGKGTVTAVAPGSAVITVSSGDLTAQCTVKCSWTASKPAESKPAESKPAGSAKPSAPSQSAQDKLPAQEEKSVDLAAFFTKIEKDYDMSSMEAADGELIENCYPGLSAIQTQQLAVYMCMMNPSPNGDVVLVQVKDSKDVDAVKAILHARIQYMVGDGNGPGGGG